jgi:DNA mismatch endonuclease (patch repair protein)
MRPGAVPPSPGVRARMQKQARRDTGPELQLRRALHLVGYRFRVNYAIPGARRRTMDIAFTRRRVAVFVDGCFWHACPQHATWPQSNSDWWREKLELNVLRDRDTDARLEALGWAVVRVWEHAPVEQALEAVLAELRQR